MAWEMSRPVPWQRLMREWVIYAAIMAVAFLLIFNDGNTIGAMAGVLVSGPLYLAFGWVLAKFGYQRKTLKELRSEQPVSKSKSKSKNKNKNNNDDDDEAAVMPSRRPVAPSSRTAGGGNRPPSNKKRRR